MNSRKQNIINTTIKPLVPSESKRNGQLPQYIVNFEELANAIYESLGASKFLDAGTQRFRGLSIDASNKKDVYKVFWDINEDYIFLTGITFFANDIRNIGYDNYFDMYINDELIFENIYFKEIQEEYKIFTIRRLLTTNDKIIFYFYNKNKMIENVYFNIDYIGDIKVKRYIIKCIEERSGDILKIYDIYLVHPSNEIILPPEIEDYILLYPEQIEISTVENEDGEEFIFYYKKKEYEIDHDFDIMIKILWTSATDIDSSLYIHGQQLWRGNKTFELDDDNKIWLDRDCIASSPGDWSEIYTILGFKNSNAIIGLQVYSGAIPNFVTIEVIKAGKSVNGRPTSDEIIGSIKIDGNKIREGRGQYEFTKVCEISLQDEIKIRPLV